MNRDQIIQKKIEAMVELDQMIALCDAAVKKFATNLAKATRDADQARESKFLTGKVFDEMLAKYEES